MISTVVEFLLPTQGLELKLSLAKAAHMRARSIIYCFLLNDITQYPFEGQSPSLYKRYKCSFKSAVVRITFRKWVFQMSSYLLFFSCPCSTPFKLMITAISDKLDNGINVIMLDGRACWDVSQFEILLNSMAILSGDVSFNVFSWSNSCYSGELMPLPLWYCWWHCLAYCSTVRTLLKKI